MTRFRKAISDDYNLLINLYLSEIEPSDENAKGFASNLLDKMRTILAFSDEEICGTISWDVRGGLDDGIAEIISLGVNATYQRRGIARSLLDEVVSDANQVFAAVDGKLRVLYLFMESNNEVARMFYNNLGFHEVTSIQSFYPHADGSIFIRQFES